MTNNDNVAHKHESLPEPLNEFDEFQLEHMVEIMQEPVRAINTCITKQQLKKLCKQLLAQNIALQTQVQSLQKEVAHMKMSSRY